jgi:hypothetical protein
MSEGRTSELISGMTFLGVRHDKNKETIDLLPWPKESKDRFVAELDKKFEKIAVKPNNNGDVTLSASLEFSEDERVKEYFNKHIENITRALGLTCITTDEDLLVVNGTKEDYVYFGGMTETLVYVACWMVVPADYVTKPKLLFWFLNTFYVQELQSLEATQVNINALEACTDLRSSPDF